MLNSHDYSNFDDEPTVPSFRIDLRRGRIVNQFGSGMIAIHTPRLRFDWQFRAGLGLAMFWNKDDRAIEITLPFLKVWIHRS